MKKEEKILDESQLYIKGYIDRAKVAQAAFEKFSQEEIDRIVMTIGKVIADNAEMLAEMAVEETGMGNYPDKVIKNQNKAKIIWNSLKGKKSTGIIERDASTGITKVAKPVGVVAAITPCTNPIVTPMSNAMFAVKCANAIIITPHHKALGCSTKAIELINAEISKLGAPENLIQILGVQNRDNTRNLISEADVVIATGGMGMVTAAYSSGKPALGVGAGNVQVILDKDINYDDAIPKVITGRTFDNGIICSGEQTAICPADKYEDILKIFEENNSVVIRDKDKIEAIRNAVFVDGAMNRHAVGQDVQAIAKLAGIDIPEDTKLIVVEGTGKGDEDILSHEKMCPVLTAYKYDTFEEAVEIAKANLEAEGKGHSVCIHSNTKENIEFAGTQLSVSRFVINQVCASSAGGSFYNGLAPTNTLGCGSWGHNSISENLDYKHLMNVSRIAEFMPDNKVPTDEELWSL